mmetsp:Transcript_8162/g.21873  ORF Transcript_8162/g.21873 Transcript_8162/m.21873 type:complete len:81 (-) Transcript_8162:3563-3805(-)
MILAEKNFSSKRLYSYVMLKTTVNTWQVRDVSCLVASCRNVLQDSITFFNDNDDSVAETEERVAKTTQGRRIPVALPESS